MDKQVIAGIAAGGLLHDIGKFAERGASDPKGDEKAIRKRFRWEHAYHTDQVLAELFPQSATQSISHALLGTSSLRELASRHHCPGNKLQGIIQCADWLAAGHERQRSDLEAKQYGTEGSTTKDQQPLISILSRINLPETKGATPGHDRHYRLQIPLLDRDISAETMYPCTESEYPSTAVRAAYPDHWHKFKEALQPFDLIDNFDTILEVCRLYQWCLPESTRRQDLSDVSLFEHQKTTAAIASCSFLYHEEHGQQGDKLTWKTVKSPTAKKFVLFCGDLSGIQHFVYQISAKGAYKMLKGRSFFIQLLAELLARQYLEPFGLTSANILYCSGGKFYLLLPNLETTTQLLQDMTEAVNGELFDLFNGDLYLRIGKKELCGFDLASQDGSNSLSMVWDDLARQVAVEDRRRHAEMAGKEYERLFGVMTEVPTGSCPVCHCTMEARSAASEAEACRTCLDMRTIGQKLKTARFIVLSDSPTALEKTYTLTIFGKYLWFCEATPQVTTDGCLVWSLNSTDFIRVVLHSRANGRQLNGAPFIVGGNHTFDREERDLQFDDIANKGEGVRRLGVLRMDVDNLGRIFREGLNNYRHDGYANRFHRLVEYDDDRFHSLARLTTLSWQLAYFFGSMVPQGMASRPEWQGKSTVVYAGGDDLFILGAWHTVPEMALEIQRRFTSFCCHNPVFSLSGGMVLTDGKFPIYKSAEMAGAAEHLAKRHHTRFRNARDTVLKESFTFLDTVMHWREFLVIAELKRAITPLLATSENRPLLDRLREIFGSWEKSKAEVLRAGPTMHMQGVLRQLEAEKWRWRMVYALARFVERHPLLVEQITALQRFILDPVATSDRTGIELLGVLSRWCELQARTPENRKGGDDDRNR